jgi:hypothetical protein
VFRLDQSFGAVTEKLDTLINKHVTGGGREDELRELLYYKSMLSQAPAGEPVGILAAQVKHMNINNNYHDFYKSLH